MYSEEAQEARNKHNRQYRLRHSRKTSRVETITDQFHYLLITSDPVISGIIMTDIERPRRQRQRQASAHEVDISPLLCDREMRASQEGDDDEDGDVDEECDLL